MEILDRFELHANGRVGAGQFELRAHAGEHVVKVVDIDGDRLASAQARFGGDRPIGAPGKIAEQHDAERSVGRGRLQPLLGSGTYIKVCGNILTAIHRNPLPIQDTSFPPAFNLRCWERPRGPTSVGLDMIPIRHCPRDPVNKYGQFSRRNRSSIASVTPRVKF